jgi:hypothetical protein
MADIDLTQAEADNLIGMEKHRISEDNLDFPGPGERLGVFLGYHPLDGQDHESDIPESGKTGRGPTPFGHRRCTAQEPRWN